MSTRLVTELTTALGLYGYTPLVVLKGIWKPRALAPFTRYAVFVAPPTTDPWTERFISSREVVYILRADIFLLVKNYNEEQSVYGDTAPNLGVFQMIADVKAILRATDLSGLVERTYEETTGGSAFETGAAAGFDTGEYGWVHRAKVTYRAQMHGFCIP
jgi:hypothetical protein